MERAETSGDAQLAEAAYHVATLRGAQAIADAYLADRPAAHRRWELYVRARQEDSPLTVNALAGVVGPQRPSELG
jgi:hypothetical protein